MYAITNTAMVSAAKMDKIIVSIPFPLSAFYNGHYSRNYAEVQLARIKIALTHDNKRKKGGSKMIEKDTIKLLRECDAGIKMGVQSIDDVLSLARDVGFRRLLKDCRHEHIELQKQVEELLLECGDEGKNPNPVASGMSWIKTNVKLGLNSSDKTIASLMTDACKMGVKSLNRYLNQYEAASERTKDITKRLINLEEKLAVDVRDYL